MKNCPLANGSLNSGPKPRKFIEAKEVSKFKSLSSNLETEKILLKQVKQNKTKPI